MLGWEKLQPIVFGVSINLNLQSQSHWSLFNGTYREQDHRLRFENEETTLRMQKALVSDSISPWSPHGYGATCGSHKRKKESRVFIFIWVTVFIWVIVSLRGRPVALKNTRDSFFLLWPPQPPCHSAYSSESNKTKTHCPYAYLWLFLSFVTCTAWIPLCVLEWVE